MGADLMFRPAYDCEDRLGIAEDENHMVFRWLKARVFFSCCEKGQALSAHFSAGPEALRLIRPAIDEFCAWAFESMPWCRMIFACIVRQSVARLVEKCGFSLLETRGDLQIYVRFQPWEVS
jgi:hypothetical protein